MKPITGTSHRVHCRASTLALAALLLGGASACGGGGGGGGGDAAPLNAPPLAQPGPDLSRLTGQSVTLDGSTSRDPEGQALSYQWTLAVRPAGSAALLSDADTARPSWRVDLPGAYVATLIVSDGQANSAPASMTVFASAAPATRTDNAPPGYALVWSDEFDRDGLPDPAKWTYDTSRNALGWYNNERQYYARDRPENARVEGGRLIITARKEDLSAFADWGGQAYSSARLLTRGKASWTYGFIEVRAKVPCGAGTWSAAWTLGTGGRWPDDGEIDIMEHVGRSPDRIFGVLHTLLSGGQGTGAETRVADACTAFHDYQLTWTADEIVIGVDGVAFYRAINPRSGRAAWPFDAAQFLLLNVAIGGNLGGAVNDAIFPVAMEVEHVRVYQKP